MNIKYIRTNDIKYSDSNNGYLVPDIQRSTNTIPIKHQIYAPQVNLTEYEYNKYLYRRQTNIKYLPPIIRIIAYICVTLTSNYLGF